MLKSVVCVFLCVTYRCLRPLASGWRVWAAAVVEKVLWPASSACHPLQLDKQTIMMSSLHHHYSILLTSKLYSLTDVYLP